MMCRSAAKIFILIYFINQNIDPGSTEGTIQNEWSPNQNRQPISSSPTKKPQCFINNLQQTSASQNPSFSNEGQQSISFINSNLQSGKNNNGITYAPLNDMSNNNPFSPRALTSVDVAANSRTQNPNPSDEDQQSINFIKSNQQNGNNNGITMSTGNEYAPLKDTTKNVVFSRQALAPVNLTSNSQAQSSQQSLSLADSSKSNDHGDKPSTLNILSGNTLQVTSKNNGMFASNSAVKPPTFNNPTISSNDGPALLSSFSSPNFLTSPRIQCDSNNDKLNSILRSASPANIKPTCVQQNPLNSPTASLNPETLNLNSLPQNQLCNPQYNAQANPFFNLKNFNSLTSKSPNSQSVNNNVLANTYSFVTPSSDISDKVSLNQCNKSDLLSSTLNGRPEPKTSNILRDISNPAVSFTSSTPLSPSLSINNNASPIMTFNLNEQPVEVNSKSLDKSCSDPTFGILNNPMYPRINTYSNGNPQNNLQVTSPNINVNLNSVGNTAFSSNFLPKVNDLSQISTPCLSPLSPNAANTNLNNMITNSIPSTTFNNFIVSGFNQPRIIPEVTLSNPSISFTYVDVPSGNSQCSNVFTSPTTSFTPNILANTQCNHQAFTLNLDNVKLSQNNLFEPDFGQIVNNSTVSFIGANGMDNNRLTPSMNRNPSSMIPFNLNEQQFGILNNPTSPRINTNSNGNCQNNQLHVTSPNNLNSAGNTAFSSNLLPKVNDLSQISIPCLSPLSQNPINANANINMITNSVPPKTFNNFIVSGYNQPRIIPKVTLSNPSISSTYVDVPSIGNSQCSNVFSSPTTSFTPNMVVPPSVPSIPITYKADTFVPSYSPQVVTYLQTKKSSPVSDHCASLSSGLVEYILSAFDSSSPVPNPQTSCYVETYDPNNIPVMFEYYGVPETVNFNGNPYSESSYAVEFVPVAEISPDLPVDCDSACRTSPLVLPSSPLYPTSAPQPIIIDDGDEALSSTSSRDLLKLLLFNEALGCGCNSFNTLLAFLLASAV